MERTYFPVTEAVEIRVHVELIKEQMAWTVYIVHVILSLVPAEIHVSKSQLQNVISMETTL